MVFFYFKPIIIIGIHYFRTPFRKMFATPVLNKKFRIIFVGLMFFNSMRGHALPFKGVSHFKNQIGTPLINDSPLSLQYLSHSALINLKKDNLLGVTLETSPSLGIINNQEFIKTRTYGMSFHQTLKSNWMSEIYLYQDQFYNTFDDTYHALMNLGVELHSFAWSLGSNIYFPRSRNQALSVMDKQFFDFYTSPTQLTHQFGLDWYIATKLNRYIYYWVGTSYHVINANALIDSQNSVTRVQAKQHVTNIVVGARLEMPNVIIEIKAAKNNLNTSFQKRFLMASVAFPLLTVTHNSFKDNKLLCLHQSKRHLAPITFPITNQSNQIKRHVFNAQNYIAELKQRLTGSDSQSPTDPGVDFLKRWALLNKHERYAFHELAKGKGNFSRLPVEIRANILDHYKVSALSDLSESDLKRTTINFIEKLSTFSQDKRTFLGYSVWPFNKKSQATHLLTLPTWYDYLYHGINNGY